jgi:uncharacterized protein
MTSPKNPCVQCGACCAFFRVQFYWREVEKNKDYQVPEPTEDLDPFKKCMKGTNKKNHPQCVALKGRIGEQVGCMIYENRPSVCRTFTPSYADGKPNKRCDRAREAHGLRPLHRKDWSD